MRGKIHLCLADRESLNLESKNNELQYNKQLKELLISFFMGLEYDLLNPPEQSPGDRIRELQIELAPRNQCCHFVLNKSKGKATLVTKEEFCSHRDFLDGPFGDSYGDGYGEPYNPFRQAFGELRKSHSVIYCELSPSKDKLARELLELVNQNS